MQRCLSGGWGRIKIALLVAAAGGTLFGSACSGEDIKNNLIAGSLSYVKGGATTFWDSFIPQDELWEGFFNPTPQESDD
ncbi:MAG: hypothetical protein ACYSUI_23860 [Planctomycetota bacterium]|jgi:hypothetical protein